MIGQNKIVESLQLIMKARNRLALPHFLFTGAGGMGKSSLAEYIKEQSGFNMMTINASSVKDTTNIDKIFLNIQQNGDIVFIDEIHNLPSKCQEHMYHAMETFNHYVLERSGDEPIKLELPKFTIIGATTNPSKLKESLFHRFVYKFALEDYTKEEMSEIIKGMSEVQIDSEFLADFCRGVPRKAHNLVTWINDYCKAEGINVANSDLIKKCLDTISVSKFGLTKDDISYLRLLSQHKGETVGLSTISSCTNIDQKTIEHVIEPYLLKAGFVNKRARGRIISLRRFPEIQDIL